VALPLGDGGALGVVGVAGGGVSGCKALAEWVCGGWPRRRMGGRAGPGAVGYMLCCTDSEGDSINDTGLCIRERLYFLLSE
jgi:hypothetical protein